MKKRQEAREVEREEGLTEKVGKVTKVLRTEETVEVGQGVWV